MIELNNSEIIKAFLDLLRTAKSGYEYAHEHQIAEEKKTQDILHRLELENTKYRERAKLATQLMNVRQKRREYKDECEEYEDIVEFVTNNKGFVNKLEQLLGQVRKVEQYHESRRYTPKTG